MTGKLEHYRVFCKVVQNKSFSKAAQDLFLSQPAVSQAVRQLEEQLGTQLLLRSSKKVELTARRKAFSMSMQALRWGCWNRQNTSWVDCMS